MYYEQLPTLHIIYQAFLSRTCETGQKKQNHKIDLLVVVFLFFCFSHYIYCIMGKVHNAQGPIWGSFFFFQFNVDYQGQVGFFAYAINLTPDLTVKLLIKKKRFSLCLHVSIISVKLNITKMDLQWEHDISFDSVRKANLVLGGIFLVVMTSCNKDVATSDLKYVRGNISSLSSARCS